LPNEIAIYQDIDSATGFGPQALRDALAVAAGEPVTIRLNSQGGNVIDGLACYNLLKQYPAAKTVIIDGMALSIASLIAMAGDSVEIAENSWMMIHNPNNEAAGDGDAMREMAGLLDGMRDQLANTYAAKSGKTPDECRALMAAETWMTGPQAVEAGFADVVTASLAVAASFDRKRFSNPPIKEIAMPAATFADLKKHFPKAKSDFIVRCQERSLDLDAARAEFDEDMAATLAQVTEELTKCRAELSEMKNAVAKSKAEELLVPLEEIVPPAEEDPAKAKKSKAKAEDPATTEEEKAAAKARARGVKPVPSGASARGGQTATAAWYGAIDAKMQGGMPRAKAVRAVILEQPELQDNFIAEANAR
jgi:ATP-dependent protease ClpP protease subunit